MSRKTRAKAEVSVELGWAELPRDIRRFLWTQRNQVRRRDPQRLGEIATAYVAGAVDKKSRRLAQVSQAWLSALPAELASLTDIGSLRRGCLEVLVDGAATQYVLSRRHEAEMLEKMRAALPGVGLSRIRYRIAPQELTQGGHRPN